MMRNNLLLADDPEILKAMERSIFTREGFLLTITGSGQEALEIIADQDPLLAILNLDMRDLNGDLCCRQVKDDPVLRATPIILTARPNQKNELERCGRSGCDEILNKPIDGQNLIALACRLLNIVHRAPPRYAVRLDARIAHHGGKPASGRILNLHAGGAFVQTKNLHPVETRLTLFVDIPGSAGSLTFQGRVAWVNHPEWIKNPRLPPGMGIQFLDLGPEAKEAIDAVMSSSNPLP